MDWIETLIVAIVEGLTEFLPVSSTGHMIIAQNLLGVPQGDPFVHAFTFIIQFGAILSVVCLYWKRFFKIDHTPDPMAFTWWQKLKHKYHFYWLLLVGVLPAVVIGLIAKKSGLLDWLLDSVEVVAIMLVVGGVFMLYCDKLFNKGSDKIKVNEHRAFMIGLVAFDGNHRRRYGAGAYAQECRRVLVLPGCAHYGRSNTPRPARPAEGRYVVGHCS